MKNLLLLLSIIAGSGYILTQTACSEDKCENTSLASTVKKSFFVSGKILYQNYEPYNGPLHFSIYKEYCDGTISGSWGYDLESRAYGEWFTPSYFIYKFDNTEDFVLACVSVSQDGHPREDVCGKVEYNTTSVDWPDYELKLFLQLSWNPPPDTTSQSSGSN